MAPGGYAVPSAVRQFSPLKSGRVTFSRCLPGVLWSVRLTSHGKRVRSLQHSGPVASAAYDDAYGGAMILALALLSTLGYAGERQR